MGRNICIKKHRGDNKDWIKGLSVVGNRGGMEQGFSGFLFYLVSAFDEYIFYLNCPGSPYVLT